MKIIKFFRYFIESLIIVLFFLIFKVLGVKKSSYISGKIFCLIGPLFRSKKIINQNFKTALPNVSEEQIKNYTNNMWNYYGRILAEYPFLQNFRNNSKNINIEIIGKEILEDIHKKNENVIFVSGHFDNFELMAMAIEKAGIKLAAIYRPLNNFFMDKIMVYLRKKYICKIQIKKGRSSVRQLVRLFKSGYSMAIMIDQRVSEGIKSPFFNKEAYSTTIPGQFVKKFNCRVVPIYIERKLDVNFKIKVLKPLKFEKSESIKKITNDLNLCLEKMIINNPSKWIWSHNRWK
jgi:Kdo2-lipid IVA lauroyltransferase/acyltransferase